MEEDTESSEDVLMEETDQPSPMTLKDSFTRFEVRRVLQGEDSEQAKQPYSCLFGEEENALHDDLSKLSNIVMRCPLKQES